MRYSEELVWKACKEFVPGMVIAKESGVTMNLPSTLNSAAVQCFLIADTGEFKTSTDKAYASLIIRVAINELQTVGWMEFGDVEEYWM